MATPATTPAASPARCGRPTSRSGTWRTIRSWARPPCPRRSHSAGPTSTTSDLTCGRSSRPCAPGSRWSRMWCSVTTRRWPATWRMSRTSGRAPCRGTTRRRLSAVDRGLVLRRLTGRNAQVSPVGATQGLGHIDDLTYVVARVRDGALQRRGDGVRLAPDGHGPLEIGVGEVAEGREQDPPAIVPLGLELRARHGAGKEFGVAVAPRLLAVGRQEVREARLQVAGDVPHDGGDGVARARGGHELGVGELVERAFGEGLVAAVFGFDGGDKGGVRAVARHDLPFVRLGQVLDVDVSIIGTNEMVRATLEWQVLLPNTVHPVHAPREVGYGDGGGRQRKISLDRRTVTVGAPRTATFVPSTTRLRSIPDPAAARPVQTRPPWGASWRRRRSIPPARPGSALDTATCDRASACAAPAAAATSPPRSVR